MSTTVSSGRSALFSGVGLKDDLTSGFLVFLIALPLCLGISMASGFPPIAGVLTAIVGGVLVTALGSARLTIKGPAAGLIVIAIGAVTELGEGDPMTGYKRALAVGVVAAVIQIVFALVRAASIGAAMPPSVVHGMLAAIGVIIISKQAHTVLGVSPEGKGPVALLAEIPHSLTKLNPEIATIGAVSLLVLFGLPFIKAKWARSIPAPMVVLVLAIPLGMAFDLGHEHTYSFGQATYAVGPAHLVQLPGRLLDALAFPDFSVVTSAVSIKYIVMFALVGTIESTLSVIAVDSLDPEKRPSNLNRDLLALGVGNLVCGLIGGLPMISEIVRSKANIDNGAKTSRANFFHGTFLLAFVALVPGLLQSIPLAALGAMLVYTGFRLASPKEFAHAKAIGLDQLALFVTTLVVTLFTDLLVGVAAGLVLKVVLHVARGAGLRALFRPQVEREDREGEINIRVRAAATFTTLLSVASQLAAVDDKVSRVTIDLSQATLVDHTFLSRVYSMAEEWPHTELELKGLEELRPASGHVVAARWRSADRA